MAKPRYIICCESRLVEPTSGLISHVNVVEVLSVAQRAVSESASRTPTSQDFGFNDLSHWILTAVWMKEDVDSLDDVFELEIVHHKADKSQVQVHAGEFQFSAHFYRIEVRVMIPPPEAAGMFTFECRIRKKDRDNPWLSQEFCIPVEFIEPRPVAR